MSLRLLSLGFAVIVAAAPSLRGQTERSEPGTTSFAVGIGGSAVTDVPFGNPSRRSGISASAAVSLRLSTFAQLRVEALAAAPSGGDFVDLLGWPFASDTVLGTRGQQPIRERGPQSSMLGFAPAIEFEPFASVPLHLRAGPVWLRSSHVDGATGSPSAPASIAYIRTTASGWGWRVGASAPLGKPDSRFVLSADVMRAQSSVGPLYLVPVMLSFRIF